MYCLDSISKNFIEPDQDWRLNSLFYKCLNKFIKISRIFLTGGCDNDMALFANVEITLAPALNKVVIFLFHVFAQLIMEKGITKQVEIITKSDRRNICCPHS